MESKRNQYFHDLFPDIPKEDPLIVDYSCALSRSILVQGRLYISENHLCFYANIFGMITELYIPIHKITGFEKKMTARIFPNAIQIRTEDDEYTFASFTSRDTTYDVISHMWRLVRQQSEPESQSHNQRTSPVGNLGPQSDMDSSRQSMSGSIGTLIAHESTIPECGKEGRNYTESARDEFMPGAVGVTAIEKDAVCAIAVGEGTVDVIAVEGTVDAATIEEEAVDTDAVEEEVTLPQPTRCAILEGADRVARRSTEGAPDPSLVAQENSTRTTILYFTIVFLVVSNLCTLVRVGSQSLYDTWESAYRAAKDTTEDALDLLSESLSGITILHFVIAFLLISNIYVIARTSSHEEAWRRKALHLTKEHEQRAEMTVTALRDELTLVRNGLDYQQAATTTYISREWRGKMDEIHKALDAIETHLREVRLGLADSEQQHQENHPCSEALLKLQKLLKQLKSIQSGDRRFADDELVSLGSQSV